MTRPVHLRRPMSSLKPAIPPGPLSPKPFPGALRDRQRFHTWLTGRGETRRIVDQCGIHRPAQGGQKVENTSIWIEDNGEVAQWYPELPLFDVNVRPVPVLNESNSVEKEMSILPSFRDCPWESGFHDLFRCALEVRNDGKTELHRTITLFPRDQPSLGSAEQSDHHMPVSVYSANGRAHWEPLLRARAIEL
jgi:hypothetical protein